jgi:hypothetical protein
MRAFVDPQLMGALCPAEFARKKDGEGIRRKEKAVVFKVC